MAGGGSGQYHRGIRARALGSLSSRLKNGPGEGTGSTTLRRVLNLSVTPTVRAILQPKGRAPMLPEPRPVVVLSRCARRSRSLRSLKSLRFLDRAPAWPRAFFPLFAQAG